MVKAQGESPYMQYKHAEQLAKEHGIVGEEVDSMLRLFHELGALLHFTATESLHGLVVLDPQWIVSSMSAVIRDKNLHAYDTAALQNKGLRADMDRLFQSGLVSRDLLEFLWHNTNVDFLIDLMKKTLLLSEWYVNNELAYIVPSLIDNAPNEQPQKEGASLVLDFTSNFLPRGVFQRLVCLCISVSDMQKTKNLPLPVIHESSARIQLAGEGVIFLEETSGCIVISMIERGNGATPESYPRLFRAMLNKIRNEVFSSRLTWETYYREQGRDAKVSEAKAKQLKLAPWFENPLNVNQRPSVELAAYLNLQ